MARTNDGGVDLMPSESSSSMANSVVVSVVVMVASAHWELSKTIVPLTCAFRAHFFANAPKRRAVRPRGRSSGTN